MDWMILLPSHNGLDTATGARPSSPHLPSKYVDQITIFYVGSHYITKNLRSLVLKSFPIHSAQRNYISVQDSARISSSPSNSNWSVLYRISHRLFAFSHQFAGFIPFQPVLALARGWSNAQVVADHYSILNQRRGFCYVASEPLGLMISSLVVRGITFPVFQ